MNVQQHERIARIKQISGYLYVCLTWARYLLWLMWPLLAVLFFLGNKVNFTIGAMQINEVELTLPLRLLLVAVASVFLLLALKLIHHFRALIKHFAEGDIFNKNAIDHARKALLNGLVIYGLHVGSALASWLYNAANTSPISVVVNADFIVALMFFGLMYVLLWALEIGCDLNEESELTI